MLVNPFAGAFKLLYDNCEGFRNFINGILEKIKTALTNAWTAITTGIQTAWNAISSFFTTIWEGIKNIFSTVLEAIKTAITTYINAYKTVITTVFNTIKTVVTTVWNMLSDILLTIIKKDIALEVNTSSVNENCVEPLPSFSVIERYQSMGGKKIILGSDAHDCKNLGNAFEETMKRLPRGLNPGYIKGRKFMSL